MSYFRKQQPDIKFECLLFSIHFSGQSSAHSLVLFEWFEIPNSRMMHDAMHRMMWIEIQVDGSFHCYLRYYITHMMMIFVILLFSCALSSERML